MTTKIYLGGLEFELSKALTILSDEWFEHKQNWNIKTFKDMRKALINLKEELIVTDQLLNERNKLLDMIPICPDHGDGCVPHAIEWVIRYKELNNYLKHFVATE